MRQGGVAGQLLCRRPVRHPSVRPREAPRSGMRRRRNGGPDVGPVLVRVPHHQPRAQDEPLVLRIRRADRPRDEVQ